MPVILHPEDYQAWLSAEWVEARKLVQPFPSQLMAVS
jgi:putative SOS response-associated peptidase YedK